MKQAEINRQNAEFAAEYLGSLTVEDFRLASPKPVKPKAIFHNNTLADGSKRPQKVLLAGVYRRAARFV